MASSTQWKLLTRTATSGAAVTGWPDGEVSRRWIMTPEGGLSGTRAERTDKREDIVVRKDLLLEMSDRENRACDSGAGTRSRTFERKAARIDVVGTMLWIVC